MLDNFRFETFVDVHSNIFAEYLSSVIAKLPKENPEYRSIEEKIEELYKEYPKVMEALDTEKPSDLSEQECKVLIEVLGLRNRLSDIWIIWNKKEKYRLLPPSPHRQLLQKIRRR